MNRGILIIGAVSSVFTIINVFASIIGTVFFCFDTCPSVASTVSQSPVAALLFVGLLSPALALIAVAWIWELIALRRLNARGTLIFTATVPVIAILAVLGVSAALAASAGIAPLAFTPLQLWSGEFALVVWPLLVCVIAFIYRKRTPAPLPLQAPV